MKKINIFFLVLCCLSFFGCEEDDKVTMLDFSNIDIDRFVSQLF